MTCVVAAQDPVDMAFMVLGTFAHLLETEAALQCLRSTHAALKPNGLLILELSHPADAFDGSLLEQTDWGGPDEPPEDGAPGELAVQYGKAGDVFDPIQQVGLAWLSCSLSSGAEELKGCSSSHCWAACSGVLLQAQADMTIYWFMHLSVHALY